MVMWYWSADTLFWQVSIDHNMDIHYQRRMLWTKGARLCHLLAGVWPPSSRSDSIAVMLMYSRAIPLAINDHDKINSRVSFFLFFPITIAGPYLIFDNINIVIRAGSLFRLFLKMFCQWSHIEIIAYTITTTQLSLTK